MLGLKSNNKVRWLLASVLFTGTFAHSSTPYTPSNGEVILETLAKSVREEPLEIRSLRESIRQDKYNSIAVQQLAKHYIELGRTTSNPRYFGYAEQLIKPWNTTEQVPTELLILRAYLQQQKHNFSAALSDLAIALQQHPNHPEALLQRNTLHLLIGDFDAARQDCQTINQSGHTWLSLLCRARLASLSGDTQQGLKLIQLLQQRLPFDRLHLKQWLLTLEAETAWRMGDRSTAQHAFKKALKLPQHDAYLLKTYADFLLESEQGMAVLKLLENQTKDDALLLRLAIASQLKGEEESLTHYRQMLEARYQQTDIRGQENHLADIARYQLKLLNQPEQAVVLAMKNWQQQKEPQDHFLLVESALAAGDQGALKTVTDWMKKHDYQDQRIDRLLRKNAV